MKHISLFFILIITMCFHSNAQLPIIPKPNKILYKEGKFTYAKGFDVKIIRGDYATQALQRNFVEFAKSKKIPIVSFSSTTINRCERWCKKSAKTSSTNCSSNIL